MAKLLRSLNSDHLPLTIVGLSPSGTLDSFMSGSYPDSLSMVLLRCSLVSEIMHDGLPPPVKLECHRMTIRVLV